MPLSLALAMAAATLASIAALSPPHPPRGTVDHDVLHIFARAPVVALLLGPFGLAGLHTSLLAYYHPAPVPPAICRHGTANGLSPDLLRWSPTTAALLLLILGVGAPLRLLAYGGLGADFTFTLERPRRLVTGGVYRFVQHPSYSGGAVLILADMLLFGRSDGASLACWVPPAWFPAVAVWRWWLERIFPVVLVGLGGVRVRQEERVLRATFGAEWERWHAVTARFVPGVF